MRLLNQLLESVELSFVACANACSCKTTKHTRDIERQLVSVKILHEYMLEQPGALL